MVFVLFIAIICGLGASFLVARYVQGQQQEVKRVKVWWVKKDKTQTAYTPLNKDNFEPHELEEKDADAGGFVVGDEGFDQLVKDKRMVKVSLGSGKPLMQGDVYNAASDSLRGQLEAGQVAKTIRVDQVASVAGFVQPGHRVDVEATMVMPTADGSKPYTQIILQNIEVLATNEMTSPSPDMPSKPADRVTLRLTREQALLLGSYQEGATLRLLLRPVKDKEIYNTPGRFPFGKSLEVVSTNAPDNIEAPPTAAPPAPVLPPPSAETPKDETKADATKPETKPEDKGEIPPPSKPFPAAPTKREFKIIIIDDPRQAEPVRTKTFQLEEDQGSEKKPIKIN
jgi:Flp pilus assembly protein CpaB